MYGVSGIEKPGSVKETECSIPVKGSLLSRVSILAYVLANDTY
jgi:hypothetical protein